MTRQWMALSLTMILWGMSDPSWGQGTQTISTQAARGEGTLVTVELHNGHGVTLNFRPTADIVRRAWLDDPSQVTLDFDDVRCATPAEDCAATVIHLRRIQPLNFPGLPATPTTTLTVVTDNELYTFQLAFPDAGTPGYRILEIQPERSPSFPTPIMGLPGAQVIEQGLVEAQQRHLVATDDPLWARIQAFLDKLKQGMSMSEAASDAGISEALVFQLAELGRQPSANELGR